MVSRDLGSFRKQNGEGETDGRPKNRVKIPYLGAIIGVPWREECSVTVCLSVRAQDAVKNREIGEKYEARNRYVFQIFELVYVVNTDR